MPRNSHVLASDKYIGGVEMRLAKRFRILQRCLVHPEGAPPSQAWRCIAYDISSAGIGITLPAELPPGRVITIAAWGLPGARPLRARVVRLVPVGPAWFTGCVFVKGLSDGGLKVWCSGRRDWVEGVG